MNPGSRQPTVLAGEPVNDKRTKLITIVRCFIDFSYSTSLEPVQF